MKWLKSLVKNVLTVLLSTCILLAVIEGVLRLLGVTPHIAWVNPEGPFTTHPTTKWMLKRNYSGTWSKVDFKTNALGFRDDSISEAKPEGVWRVVVMGGSTATGYGLARPYPYPDQLEQMLAATTTRSLEVVNAGIPGFSTTQNIALLNERILSLSPDLIILDFAINDIFDRPLHLNRSTAFRGGGAFLRLEEPSPSAKDPDTKTRLRELAAELPRYTALFTGVNYLRRHWLDEKMLKKETDTEQAWLNALVEGRMDPFLEKAWLDTQQDLSAFFARCDQAGIPVWVLTFPLKRQVAAKEGLDFPQRKIKAFLLKENRPFIDLLPVFRARLDEGMFADVLFLDHEHPDAPGHNATASTLQDQLLKNVNLFLPRNLNDSQSGVRSSEE